MEVRNDDFELLSGCLPNTTQLPFVLKLSHSLSIQSSTFRFEETEPYFLDCLSRKNMDTPENITLATWNWSIISLNSGECQVGMSNLQQTPTSFQKLHSLFPHGWYADLLVLILAENSFSRAEGRYLVEKIPLVASKNCRKWTQGTRNCRLFLSRKSSISYSMSRLHRSLDGKSSRTLQLKAVLKGLKKKKKIGWRRIIVQDDLVWKGGQKHLLAERCCVGVCVFTSMLLQGAFLVCTDPRPLKDSGTNSRRVEEQKKLNCG